MNAIHPSKGVATDADCDLISEAVSFVDRELEWRINAADLPENLRKAVLYAALGPGKRLRPALVLYACQAVGGSVESALPAAAAIELIHCFSLVHDDLPAMDDDNLRRGRPTLHVHAGEAMAILAGDVMMSLAFDFIVSCNADEATRASLAQELSQATTAMIVGQVYDTLGGMDSNLTDEHRVWLIHKNKTGALLRCSCRMGAICGGAKKRGMDALTAYGEAMGLMFQIVDDVIDVTQSAAHVGKATGKDSSAGKLTFPGVLGLERSFEEIARLHTAAQHALSDLGAPADPLRKLADMMAVRTK